MIKCDYCFGKGKILISALIPKAIGFQICPRCKGKGFIVEDLDEEKKGGKSDR